VTKYDWLLLVHILGAFLFVSGSVVAGILAFYAMQRDKPSEIALLLRLVRPVVIVVAVGSLVALGMGIWLADYVGYGIGKGWFHAAIVLWAAGLAHVSAGNVDFGLGGNILVGSIPGVLLGSQMTVKLPDRAMRVALALVLFLSGVKLLEPPGANAIVLGVGGIVILAAFGLAARRWLSPRPAPAAAAAGTRRTGGR